MGILDAPALTRTQGDTRYVTASKLSAARLLARLNSPDQGLPVVSTDLPTVTWGSAATLTRQVPAYSPEIRIRGYVGAWDDANARLPAGGAYSALDFVLVNGGTVEIRAIEQVANASRFWIFVDGKPIDTAPSLGMTTTAGGTIVIKLAFGSVARRRITVHSVGLVGWLGIVTGPAAAVVPAPPSPRVLLVGDSFFAGSAGSEQLLSSGFRMGQLLGADVHIAAVGGTGYGAGSSTYGSTTRQTLAQRGPAPELIVISGSVNDSAAGLQAQVTATLDAYAALYPGIPIIVFGPQPSASDATLSTARAQCVAAVRAAALAHAATIAFYDMVGTGATAAVPAAWVSNATYADGDLVSYQGSVYKRTGAGNTGTFGPGASSRWSQLTYLYTGTGKVGTTTGDGNRDTFLHSDGVHPTPDGSLALAIRQDSDIRAALAARATAA